MEKQLNLKYKMHLTNFHFYSFKNYLYSKPVKDLRGCRVGYGFSFNGKENDDETQTQDYGMRIYDYRLGRFLSTDPLTKSYPMLTPYQFASNTPIMAIDLDGCEAEVVIYGTGGDGTAYHDGHNGLPPDGKYIMNCGVAGANRMGVKARPVRSGKNLIGILTTETIKNGYIASMVYYGHSWWWGLYLYNNEGFYDNDDFLKEKKGLGSSDCRLLEDFSKKGLIKIGKSSTFIFASCGTMAKIENKTFGGSFSDAISNAFQLDEKKNEEFFSITVVGATDLVNIKPDGNAYCEGGTFISKTTTYKAEREFKDVTFFGLFKIGSKATGTIKINKVSETEKDLGKTIDPATLTN